MTAPRIASSAARCLALAAAFALAGCGATASAPAAARGSLQATVVAAPSAVKAILVTVTAQDIQGDVRTLLAQDVNGHWSGNLVDVPAGTADRTVTAYAYDSLSVPANPVQDVAGLIYRGAVSGVSVVAAQTTTVTIHVHPYPDDGGGTGLNTPPHLVTLGHPDWIATSGTAALTAAAVDPDDNTVLTYTWDDGGAGGTFVGSNPAGNQPSGAAVAVSYQPPVDFVGYVTVGLDVTDGTAHATATFKLAVGSGVQPTLVFQVLPDIAITAVQSQELMTGGTTTIDWSLSYPAGAGPDAPVTLTGFTHWTDTCGGTFDVADAPYTVASGAPVTGQVTYTAGVPGQGPCDVRLHVVDASAASAWSRVYVWVTAVADVKGLWEGMVDDQAFGPWNRVSLKLSQTGAAVTGVYQTDVVPQPWDLTGQVTGQVMTFELVMVPDPSCSGLIPGTGTLLNATTMAISYSGLVTCDKFPDPPQDTPVQGSGILTWTPPTKMAFVTSGLYDGNLGGLAGADARCQQAADAGWVAPGTYKAYLSTSTVNARDRITDARYVDVYGNAIAADRAALASGSLQMPLVRDEFGGWTPDPTWTGTYLDGLSGGAAQDNNCADWTVNGGTVGIDGDPNSTGIYWQWGGTTSCSTPLHLYCFQQ